MMTVNDTAVKLYNGEHNEDISSIDELSEMMRAEYQHKARNFLGIKIMDNTNYDLEADQEKAWELLCKDMEGGLHQYDNWDEVPIDVKNEYVSRILKGKDVMGDNEGNVADTLKQRGGIYGSYENVCAVRSSILKNLDVHHKQVNGGFMEPELMVAFGDLVLKLVRAAGAPKYADSFHDLGGYAKLMEDIANER